MVQFRFVEETYFEVESLIALIVVHFEEIAEKDLLKKPSLRGGLHIALIERLVEKEIRINLV